MKQIRRKLKQVAADGAYDTRYIQEAIMNKRARDVIPPKTWANKNRVSIDERPPVVDEKGRIGDWEIDTVIGKGHSGALVTIVERATQFTVSAPVSGKTAEAVTAATIELLRPYAAALHTIAADNGKEFAYHD